MQWEIRSPSCVNSCVDGFISLVEKVFLCGIPNMSSKASHGSERFVSSAHTPCMLICLGASPASSTAAKAVRDAVTILSTCGATAPTIEPSAGGAAVAACPSAD